MCARNAWLFVGLASLGIGAVVLPACEEQADPPMSKGIEAPEHDPYFPIGESDPHKLGRAIAGLGSISCASCHTGGDTFEFFTCMNCHAPNAAAERTLDNAHASARGYAKNDASCYACHPRGQAIAPAEGEGEGEGEPFDHTNDAFPLPHGDVGCDECHADVGGDYSLTLCWGCHQDDANPTIYTKHDPLAAVFDANDNETGCRECHAATPAFPMSSHDPFMFPGHPFSPVCNDCHRTNMAEPKEWAIDFKVTTCTNTTGCHSQEPTCAANYQEGC